MIKCYLNNVEVDVEISPDLVQTLDETLDNLMVSLRYNDDPNPILPFQQFRLEIIENNTTTTFKFIVSNDNVELIAQNPAKYKHTLSLIQLSEFLTKHEIRNTVFSTSLEGSQFTLNVGASVFSDDPNITGHDPYGLSHNTFNYAATPLSGSIDLSTKKINHLSMKVNFFIQRIYRGQGVLVRDPGYYLRYISSQYYNPTRWSEVYDGVSAPSTATDYLPVLVFTIGGESKSLTLLNSETKNGDVIDFERYNATTIEILEWIKSKTSGTLTFSINQNAFIDNAPFVDKDFIPSNKIPALVAFNTTFYVDSTEMSVYDVIDTLLKQQMKETKAYNRNNDNTVQPLFLLPTSTHNSDLYNLLKDTSSPNFIFTQSNMYEALVEIFKLFDAIFTIDNDGYLDIEYYNEHNEIVLQTNKVAGITSSLSEERYVNKLISYYQNSKIDDRFPNSNDEKATAYVRSKTLGVPAQSDYVFLLPKPIDIIKKVFMQINGITNTWRRGTNPIYTYYYFTYPSQLLDITDNVVESSIWSILPDDTTNLNTNKKYKYNCFSYDRGSNYIDISGYYNTTYNIQNQIIINVIKAGINRRFGVSSTDEGGFLPYPTSIDYHNVKMSVEYIALTDGKIVIESIDNKYNGELLTNQNNGSIDINKLGLNMVGLSLKLGQPTKTLTYKFTNYSQAIKKGQYFIDDNGDKWVANVCTFKIISPTKMQETIDFVKNFNGLASRIQLNREKRLTNISNELTVKCEETYGEYVYYTSAAKSSITHNVEPIAFRPFFLANQLGMCFGSQLPDKLYLDERELVVIVNKTIAQAIDYVSNQKELIRVVGTVDSVENGDIVISSGGNSILVPHCYFDDFRQGQVLRDIITDVLFQNTTSPFNLVDDTIEIGDSITILICKNSGEILYGVVENYNGQQYFINGYTFPYVQKNTFTIEYACITALDSANNVIEVEYIPIKDVAIPLLIYGSGNSVCFEMSYDHPLSAGNQLIQQSGFWTGGWFSKAVLYADEQGKAEKFTIGFVKIQDGLYREFPQLVYQRNFYFGQIDEFAYYKKPNEIFALNYQLHFLPYDKRCFLSNEFIKNNAFKNGLNQKELFITYSTNIHEEYSILDIKGFGTVNAISSIQTILDNVSGIITIKIITDISFTNWIHIKNWAIVDKNNNIYYACNISPANIGYNTGEFVIHFLPRHHRV